jgi:outer membrane protein assembly factor BamB
MQMSLRVRFVPTSLALSLALASSAVAASGDWPQWRGPDRNDVCAETGLLKEWPADGPPLAWKVASLGKGYSGLSIVGDRIFTMGDGAESCEVLALNRADGKTVWSTKMGRPGGGGGYPGPRCTPTVDGDRVFALSQHGDLLCVEAATGKEVWRKNLSKDFGGRMMSGWGYAESPLVDGNNLVCSPGGTNGTVVALDKKTGELVWRSKEFTDSAAYASLVKAQFGGVPQYAVLTDAHVAGIAANDGRLLWKGPRRGRTAVIPTPIISGDFVYVTSGYGVGCNLFKVTKSGDAFSAEQVYANKDMANHHGGVVLVGEHLYGHSDAKGWVCQELKSGNVVWSDKGVGKGSVLFADGNLYTRSEGGKGVIALVEASPAGYREKGRFEQPNRSDKNSWPHPVIAGGKLYIRDQDVLLCYDVKQK